MADTLNQPNLLPTSSFSEPGSRQQKASKILTVLVTTLLSQYFVSKMDEEQATIFMADWLVALKAKPIEAVKAAREEWLGTRRQRPTIAEFLELVDRHDSGAKHGKIGPPPTDLVPKHTGSFDKASPAERWSWYARMHAFCDATGRERSFDPNRRYYDIDLVRMASAENQMSGRAKVHAQMSKGAEETGSGQAKPPADVVRENWRKIRMPDLTAAERERAEPAIAALTAALDSNLAAMGKRGERGAAAGRAPPSGIETHALIAEDDPRVQQALRELDDRTPASDPTEPWPEDWRERMSG